MTDPMKFTTPADLLAYIPHALGCQPKEAFVVLTLQDQQLGATLRVDAPEEMSPADYAQTLVTYMTADTAATATVLAIYTDETGQDGRYPYREHVDELARELATADMPLMDAWIITAEHWRNYLCSDAGCCPEEPLDKIMDSHANAALIYAGSNVEAFAAPAPFTGSPGDRTLIEAHIPEGSPADVARARTLWAQVLENPAALTGNTARQLAGAFQHKMVRDCLMADVITTGSEERFAQILLGQISGRPDWVRVDCAQELAFELMKAVPEGHRAPMLCLIGWLEWLKGKSSFAARYFKLAADDVEDFRLAVLLADLVNRGDVAPVAARRDTAYTATRRN